MLCTLIGAIILSINIQVGLDMHLYDDIGDALSSFRGSTSNLNSSSPFLNISITLPALRSEGYYEVQKRKVV